jgi:hypothetical protein
MIYDTATYSVGDYVLFGAVMKRSEDEIVLHRSLADRLLFLVGTVAMLFAVAMIAGFSKQFWWWWRELALLAVVCVCVVFVRQKLVMIGAIALVVLSRLAIAMVLYFFSAGSLLNRR